MIPVAGGSLSLIFLNKVRIHQAPQLQFIDSFSLLALSTELESLRDDFFESVSVSSANAWRQSSHALFLRLKMNLLGDDLRKLLPYRAMEVQTSSA